MAWTVTATLSRNFEWTNGQSMYVFRLACLSDADASGDFTLSTLLTTSEGAIKSDMFMRCIGGGLPYQVEYIPAPATTTPTSNPTITIDNQGGVNIFSYEFTAAVRDIQPCNVVKGAYVAVTDLIIASTTLDNTKTANVDIWILK